MGLFNLTFKVDSGKLENFKERIDKALTTAGVGYVYQRGRYPAQGQLTRPYKQTRSFATLPATSFQIVKSGATMNIFAVFYGKYILGGTSKWQGWPGKWDQIKVSIANGFKKGIKEP